MSGHVTEIYHRVDVRPEAHAPKSTIWPVVEDPCINYAADSLGDPPFDHAVHTSKV
jgi:hypothetical protein